MATTRFDRTRLPALALGAALLAAACSSGNASSVPPEAPQPGPPLAFDGARAWKQLEEIVAIGPRQAGTPALEELRGQITRDLEAIGLKVVREEFENEVPVTDDTPDGKLRFCNLYADLEGQPPESDPNAPVPLVIVATHIDTKYLPNFVGANDGGSSTAAVLELARGIVAAGDRPVSYRFLFLDGEEAIRIKWEGIDNTYGSRHHAEQLSRKETFRRLKAFVLLDLVGEKDLKLTPDRNSDGWLKDIFYGAAKKLGLGKHVGDPVYDATTVKDDHLPFRVLDVPVVNLIDLDYDHWHTSEDTLDKCSQESLQVIGDIVCAGLPVLEAELLERPR